MSNCAVEMEIILAQPRGFCAGVDRAINIVKSALHQFGAPVYVRHEIVHNTTVVNSLRQKGAIFVESLADVPPDHVVIFSAHGVSKAVREEAIRRKLKIFDATCPLVSKVHSEVTKMYREGREIIMIGHPGHPEVEGTLGQINTGMYLVATIHDVDRLQVKNSNKLAYVSQTTLSVDDTADIIAALKKKFPMIAEPQKADICYATTNRQWAMKKLATYVDIVIVVGSAMSSNSNRLREVAEKMGISAYMIDDVKQIDAQWLLGKKRIGLTAGASAPEVLVQAVIDHLKTLGAIRVRVMEGREEKVVFQMPKTLAYIDHTPS